MTKSKDKHWKEQLYEIIYEADTPRGKWFDLVLMATILASVVLVMLESVPSIGRDHAVFFNVAEWIITSLFTVEYFLRILSIKSPKRYIFSYLGLVDLLSTLPKYLSLIFGGTHALVVLRALRLLRVFRILKITRYVSASNKLLHALKTSRPKIAVFLFAVIIIAIVLGTIMYLVEAGANSGFTSIPRSVYWTVVTLTTVGYGDIAPVTTLGQFIASLVMVLGYGILAVPTGIVSAEYSASFKKTPSNVQACSDCNGNRHADDALFCDQCGEKL